MGEENLPWHVYVLECVDGTLYTGCTNDLPKRIQAHNEGNGAKYTRSRLPVRLVYQETVDNRSTAQQREAQLKKLSRHEKLLLIQGAGVLNISGNQHRQ